MRKALVLVLSVWAALPAAGRAEEKDKSPVVPPPGPVVVDHGAPGGCATCGHAPSDGCDRDGCRHELSRPCLSRILQWATYRPLGCGSCRSCGACCKEGAPCCNPPPYAYFLHRCASCAQVHRYRVVYKTWEGHWPPAYAGGDDQGAGIYTDEDRLSP
jgi:hypothetical protein